MSYKEQEPHRTLLDGCKKVGELWIPEVMTALKTYQDFVNPSPEQASDPMKTGFDTVSSVRRLVQWQIRNLSERLLGLEPKIGSNRHLWLKTFVAEIRLGLDPKRRYPDNPRSQISCFPDNAWWDEHIGERQIEMSDHTRAFFVLFESRFLPAESDSESAFVTMLSMLQQQEHFFLARFPRSARSGMTTADFWGHITEDFMEHYSP